MTTALPSPRHSSATVSVTAVRNFIQSETNDSLLRRILHRHFDSAPADAMMQHRLPRNRWRHDQVDGADYHADLTSAVERGTSPGKAPAHLRPALHLLHRYRFVPACARHNLVLENPALHLRGACDFVGTAGERPALIEVKTVHRIPHSYPYLENSVQAAALFQLMHGRPPGPDDFVRLLYVASTHPHHAYLLPVHTPDRFAAVARDIAFHLAN